MKFLAGNANLLRQRRFDIHVHIFQCYRPGKVSGFDLGADFFQTLLNLVALLFAEHAHLSEHGGVGDGALNVLPVEAVVKTDGGGKTFDKGVGGFTEAPAPEFGLVVLAHSSLAVDQAPADGRRIRVPSDLSTR